MTSRFAVLLLLFATVLAACNPPTVLSPTPTADAASPQASSTPAPLPTDTPEPARALLIAPAGSETRAQAAEAAIKEAAPTLHLETRSEAAPGDLSASVKLVIFLAAPQNLEQLLSAAPQAQFVVISGADVPAKAPNLSIIRVRPENQAFLAGYLSELVTADWRAAGLLPSEDLSSAFLAGGHYWCGRCTPTNPPLVLFPLTAVLPGGSPPADWQAAADALQQKVLEVVYLSPEASSKDLILSLVDRQVRIVGSQPPPVEAAAVWVATVQMDEMASLRALLPDLLAGKGGQTVNADLSVRDINPELLSAGRQRLVDETRAALEKGLINPLPVQ